MMLRFLSILFCTVSIVLGEGSFSYYVIDETQTDKLHYGHVCSLAIDDPADSSPSFVFYTEYRIYGCAQDSFTYTGERCDRRYPPERFQKLLTAIRQIPLHKLLPQEQRSKVTPASHGHLQLGKGDDLEINADLKLPERAKLHALILAFLDETAPKAARQTFTRTIEGDLVPARPVTFETLLRNPKQFDGQRIKLSGYYHIGFEESRIRPTRDADNQDSVWVGGDSKFAKPANLDRPNDTFITVEGSFNAGSGPYPDMNSNRIERVTRVKTSKP